MRKKEHRNENHVVTVLGGSVRLCLVARCHGDRRGLDMGLSAGIAVTMSCLRHGKGHGAIGTGSGLGRDMFEGG